MLRVELIRHSMTAGNLKKRYIGAGTDEPLCREGVELLRGREYPPVEELYVSPMRRCRQTAAMIYPDMPQHVVGDLRECDFGEFENKNYLELGDNPHYQAWVDSGGTLPFPGGESREEFAARCLSAFEKLAGDALSRRVSSAALVVHGGTIMSIMEKYGSPRASWYSWQIGNGERCTLLYE